MALVHDSEHGLWALGPESGGRALLSAEMPHMTLPDRHGMPFSLSSLRGRKVLLVVVGLVVRMPLRPARVAGTANRAASEGP